MHSDALLATVGAQKVSQLARWAARATPEHLEIAATERTVVRSNIARDELCRYTTHRRVTFDTLTCSEDGSNDMRTGNCSLRTIGVLVALLGAASFGCQDKEKCDDALRTARQAMQDEYLDMQLARQWRDYAGKACGAGDSLAALDQEILAREAEIAKKEQEVAAAAEEAGRQAIETSKQLWRDFDALDAKQRNQEQLKSTYSKAKKLGSGLTEAYAKQVQDYNEKQYEKRQQKL